MKRQSEDQTPGKKAKKGKHFEEDDTPGKSSPPAKTGLEQLFEDESLRELATVNTKLWQHIAEWLSAIKQNSIFADIEAASALDITDGAEEDSGFQDASTR